MTAPDLIVRGATVHTMDAARPRASALAVTGGTITAVGDDQEVAALAGRRTEVVDGRGLTVTPGLVDSHQHPLIALSQERGVDLTGLTDLGDLCRTLEEYAAGLPEHAWVVARGTEYLAFAPRTPHRETIDAAVGGRPALLSMIDAHNALLSTEGLRRAGITGAVEFADHSEVDVDDEGRPTGYLRELSAVLLAQEALPSIDAAEAARELARRLRAQHACGITGLHVLDLSPQTLETLELLSDQDRLTARVLLAPWALPGRTRQTLEMLHDLRERGGRLWRTGAVKFLLDGTIDGGAAWLHHPDCHGEGTRPIWREPGDYREAVGAVAELGLPSFTHAIGDRAVSYALDTCARVGGPARGRHRIEHAELVCDEDVARFAALDVVASMHPTHMDWTVPDHTDNWSARVGPERWVRAWRYGDIVAAGGRVALGSDWPIAHFDPRLVMAGARLRRPAGRPDRAPVGAGQALTAYQALAGYTLWAAYGAGEEDRAGTVREGARADLTVFAGDPLAVSPDELAELPVALTVVDGRVVHRAA
ncbi:MULTISPECIES: amidohydrolase [unclassified Nocardiopsis]|uniref:amidohydrolase n=1 Tax=unclassified Nocardiopsis TaxID=2649073 RepID=UPI001359E26E|nr:MULTISPECIES: amidohydrolase [unclassified Nocardiopsis]